MVFVLDIGNTSVTYGVFASGKLKKHGSALINTIPKLVKNWCRSGREKYNTLVISSVVPKNTAFLKKALSRGSNLEIRVIGQDLPLKIRHKYKQYNKLGKDRIVNIYGALKQYRPPLLIIDFGTAITFDFVSSKKVFEGGMIVPGPEVAFQALIERAALLPKKLRLPATSASFLGKTTYDCMSTGILEGYGAMADGLIDRFKKRFGKKTKVIVTGGFARTLKTHSRHFDKVDPLHSVKALYQIYIDSASA